MKICFTICSNNYLAYAKVLGKTLKKYEPAIKFFIFLCDEKNEGISYSSLADEVIAINDIEPLAKALAAKYTIIEFNTCVKPRVFEYLFEERGAGKVIFFDPDIKIYSSISLLYDELNTASVILTPHILTPIPLDNKKPSENNFLNFGIYNLGFIGIKKDEHSQEFIAWWKERTYAQCYVDVYNGIFVDQLPINLAPVFFKNIKVIYNMGCNMAPWNLHERYLTQKYGSYIVNEKEVLVFFHFSSYKTGGLELPLSQYNRYTLSSRNDLHKIYNDYNEDLKAADDFFYNKIDYSYAIIRNAYLKKAKKEKWRKKLLFKKKK